MFLSRLTYEQQHARRLRFRPTWVSGVLTAKDSNAQPLKLVLGAGIVHIYALPISVVLSGHAVVRVDDSSAVLPSCSVTVLAISKNPILNMHFSDSTVLVNICMSL